MRSRVILNKDDSRGFAACQLTILLLYFQLSEKMLIGAGILIHRKLSVICESSHAVRSKIPNLPISKTKDRRKLGFLSKNRGHLPCCITQTRGARMNFGFTINRALSETQQFGMLSRCLFFHRFISFEICSSSLCLVSNRKLKSILIQIMLWGFLQINHIDPKDIPQKVPWGHGPHI